VFNPRNHARDPIAQLVTAAQAALRFLKEFEGSSELDYIEDALGENAPIALLEQALADIWKAAAQ